MSADHDDLGTRRGLFEPREELGAIDVGKPQVHQDELWLPRTAHLFGRCA